MSEPRGWLQTGAKPKEITDTRGAYFFALTPRTLTVVDVDKLGPTMTRVRFEADDDFAGFHTMGPEDHIKLVFGEDKRDYTVRWFDGKTLDVDFVTHEHGVAGSWALRAKVGDQVGCVGPRGSRHVRDVFPWYVFAVDEAALPALGRWLEGLRADVTATAYIVGESRDYPLPTAALLDVHWLTPGASLAEALAAHAFPDTEGFVWVAGERDLIRPARRFLKELGVDHDVDGYWKRGVVNMDHHAPDPED